MLKEMCKQHGFEFLENHNITLQHIGHDGVHLTKPGTGISKSGTKSGTELIYDNILEVLHKI